jgi:hypothetical protein
MKRIEPEETRAVTGGVQSPRPRDVRPEEPFVPDKAVDLDIDHSPTDPPQ